MTKRTISTRVNYYGLGGVGSGQTTTSSKTGVEVEEILSTIRQSLPWKARVKVGQHNGGVLTLRANLRYDGEVPSNKVRPAVDIEVVITSEITDSLWADVVEALIKHGYDVDAGEAPSERRWVTWPNNVSRATETDGEAIARVVALTCMMIEREIHCERCGEKLKADAAVWLERNLTTSEFHNPDTDPQPEDESQGVFPFGSTCAKRVLADRWA